jgi:hypothetical protein
VLELQNPNNKPAGLNIDVRLSDAPPTPAAANAAGQR